MNISFNALQSQHKYKPALLWVHFVSESTAFSVSQYESSTISIAIHCYERLFMMISPWVQKSYLAAETTGPKYRVIAGVIRDAIGTGHFPVGTQLPTVRQLSKDLVVSETTVARAYEFLREQGQIEGKVGSGTYVRNPATNNHPNSFASLLPRLSTIEAAGSQSKSSPWRRRTLTSNAAHLRTAYPLALDCTSGRPNPALLPVSVLRKAWQAATLRMDCEQLQYAGPHPVPLLVEQVVPRLEADGVFARESDIIVGSSAQQLIMLALQVVCTLSGQTKLIIGVEEPGYPTIFDSFERLGHQLVGIDVDAYGAIPASLENALALGVQVVLLTPRAHNPTGASWSPERMSAISNTIAAHSEVVVIEDDHFAGITTTCPGSLFSDERLGDRVIYIRSFSKSIGPDFRIAIAAARSRLRALLMEEKSFADGWSSRLTQYSIAEVLADPDLDIALGNAAEAYEDRRRATSRVLSSKVAGLARVTPGMDGVSIWVVLSPEIGSSEVIEHGASLGVLVAPGEPFFIGIGHHDVIRVNAGSANGPDQAAEVGDKLATAILRAADSSSRSFLDSLV
ncbi:MAG TPA: PLP-dependent aminotransferase family protein [Chthoniobacterales bacterium]